MNNKPMYRCVYDDSDRGGWSTWRELLRWISTPAVHAANVHGGVFAVAFVEMRRTDGRVVGRPGGI